MPLRALNSFDGLGDVSRLAETILGLIPDAGVMVVDRELRLVLMEGAIHARDGCDARPSVGYDVRDVLSSAAWTNLGPHWEAALAGDVRTLDRASLDGRRACCLYSAPLRARGDEVVGAIMVVQDITARERAREELEARLRQQSMVRELGSWALEGAPLSTLLDDAAMLLRAGLGADLTLVLEESPDGGPVVHARAGAAYELPMRPARRGIDVLRAAREPLLCRDLWAESRFETSTLKAAGMVSMVSAPIVAKPDGFGCLVACSAHEDAFVEADLGFAQSLANVLASAVERECAAP
jgi:GAF domain/PAS fold